MLAKRRSCNESARQLRTPVSTTRIIRTWWVFIDLKMKSASNILLAWTYLSGTPLTTDIYYVSDPTRTARDTRYQSAVRIQEQPRIYLPRFSWIWDRRREATAGSSVVYGGKSKVNWCRQSAACYLVSFFISTYILATDGRFCGERFCFVLNNARPLLPLETEFFETARAGKGFYHHISQVSISDLTFYSTCHRDLH